MSYIKKPYERQDDRPSKGKIAYRRFKRLFRPFIFLMLIIGFFMGGGWFIYKIASEQQYSLIRTRTAQLIPMKVVHIKIEGCQLTTEDEVKNALGIQIGSPILDFSIQTAQERLNNLPFVEYSVIKRQLPDTVLIRITERRPYAVWQNHGKFKLIDRKGQIVNDEGMKGKDGQAFLKLPLVVGAGANEYATELLNILSPYSELKKKIVAAVRIGDRRWDLDLKNGIVISLPENQELPAIQRLMIYEKKYQLLERAIKTIDLRLPDRLIIHKQPAPPPSDSEVHDSDQESNDSP